VPIAILDPFSGISGDMTLGALIDVGLDPDWLRALPGELGLHGVQVAITRVRRGEISCQKVDFEIPDQPHGRHIDQILEMIDRTAAPSEVRQKATEAFQGIAEVEGVLHGIPAARVHLHEVGAVDAILDIMGAIWGLSELGISRVYCGAISLGDGFVEAAHGVLPVPAPATLRLLEGQVVRPGPVGAGELVTPTGAALVRVLSSGPAPERFTPLRSGYGAGTRELANRVNALRVILADEVWVADGTAEHLVMLATDIDDMSPEMLAATSETLLESGALDVVLTATHMKKGRVGTRVELLAHGTDVARLEGLLFTHTSTLGVRRMSVERRALPRGEETVHILGHDVRMKLARLPNGERRAKPEFEDVRAVSRATGRSAADVAALALAALERGGT
jgi:uncharacterized protein (TIGR00299 family) protein